MIRHAKVRKKISKAAILIASLLIGNYFLPGNAMAVPTPQQVTTNSGTVTATSPSSGVLNFSQTSKTAVVSGPFSVGLGEQVNFTAAQAGSAILYLATGGASILNGKITTTNTALALQNSSGIQFGGSFTSSGAMTFTTRQKYPEAVSDFLANQTVKLASTAGPAIVNPPSAYAKLGSDTLTTTAPPGVTVVFPTVSTTTTSSTVSSSLVAPATISTTQYTTASTVQTPTSLSATSYASPTVTISGNLTGFSSTNMPSFMSGATSAPVMVSGYSSMGGLPLPLTGSMPPGVFLSGNMPGAGTAGSKQFSGFQSAQPPAGFQLPYGINSGAPSAPGANSQQPVVFEQGTSFGTPPSPGSSSAPASTSPAGGTPTDPNQQNSDSVPAPPSGP